MPIDSLIPGLLAAIGYLPISGHPASWQRSVIKLLSVGCFALVALTAGAPWALTVGLALSALGDLALSRPGERWFLSGMAAFGLAHLCYISLFVPYWTGMPVWPALALVVLTLSTELWLIPHVGPHLRFPMRLYISLIAVMGLTAFASPLAAARAGAQAFILSDLILAVQLFRLPAESRWQVPASWALWVLYVAAQVLILSAFLPPDLS